MHEPNYLIVRAGIAIASGEPAAIERAVVEAVAEVADGVLQAVLLVGRRETLAVVAMTLAEEAAGGAPVVSVEAGADQVGDGDVQVVALAACAVEAPSAPDASDVEAYIVGALCPLPRPMPGCGLNGIRASIYWKDCAGRYLGCNRSFAQHAGFGDPAEIVGCRDVDMPWSALAEHFRSRDGRVMASEAPLLDFEEPLVAVNGERLWTRKHKMPLRNAAGAVVGILGVFEDITAQKLARTALHASERAYREIFNATSDALIVWSKSGEILDANERTCEFFGTTRDALLHTTLADITISTPPHTSADAEQWLHKTFEQGAQLVEWPLRRQDGGVVWVEVGLRSAVIHNERCIVAAVRDVSERKRIEEQLRESSAKYSAYFHALPDPAGISRLRDGRLVEVNSAFADLMGMGAEDLVGKTTHELGLWADPREREAYVQGLAQNDGRYQCECTIRLRGGVDRTMLLSGRTVQVGEDLCLCFIARDVTEQKLADAELRRQADSLRAANMQLEVQWEQMLAQRQDLILTAEELETARRAAESASRAKSAFLANMSHELRTPLTAILGYTEMLAGGKETMSAEEWHAALETIHRNGEGLLEILNSVLDISRIEAGRLEIERLACRPADILQSVHDLLQLRAGQKGLALTLTVDPDMPAQIETDPMRLRQVLMNLVDNAIKFTAEGSVHVSARWRPPADGGPSLVIEVQDTGVGMAPEELARLFQPFTQADSSSARRFGGSGLGLAIAKRLCEMLGGDIVVESAPAAGSTFRVTVAAPGIDGPAKSAPTAGSAAPDGCAATAPADAATLPACRLLLVEDGLDNQKLIGAILRRAGAAVDVVANGAEAIAAITAAIEADQAYDLVVMDMQMPVMDGYAATRRLREMDYDRPILALTAHGLEGDREKCLAAGCTDYAAKPVKRMALIGTICALLRGAQAARATTLVSGSTG